MKKLIMNADDFGYTPGVTKGIIYAFKNGIVSSTTALSVSDYFLTAMKEVRHEAPDLPIGLHLTLTLNQGRPILPAAEVPSLVNETGTFWNQKVFAEKVDLDEVKKEWEAQIIQFLQCGKRPDHLDSHHNVHGRNNDLLQVALDLAKKYHLPLRNASRKPEDETMVDLYEGVATPDKMLSSFYDQTATLDQLNSLFDEINQSSKEIFEINCHPAFIDQQLQTQSSYCLQRIKELEMLTSSQVQKSLKEHQILLTNYGIF